LEKRGEKGLALWGIHHVQDIVTTAPSMVESVLVERGAGHHLSLLLDTLRRVGVSWREADRREMIQVGGPGARHVLAKVRAYEYFELEGILEMAREPGLILALDGVTDPGNFGAIVRSAVFFGVDGIIIPKNNSCGVTETVLKRSAGAVCQVKIAQVTNLVRSLEQMKEAGYWIYGTTPGSGRSVAEEEFPPKTCIVLGAEGKGVRMGVQRRCDLFLTLAGQWESLNVSSFGAVLMYAWNQGKGQKNLSGQDIEGAKTPRPVDAE